MEKSIPAARVSGKPVIILDPAAAASLVGPLGLDLSPLLSYDSAGKTWERSLARELGASARVEVPVREDVMGFTSLVAEVPGVPDGSGRVAVWAARDSQTNTPDPARMDVLAALARFAAARNAPFVFVDFDGRSDPKAVQEVLGDRRIALVLVLDELAGGVLRFKTMNGELIPALDLYAEKAGARFAVTRTTAGSGTVLEPLPGVKTVVISADGELDNAGVDATLLIGYLAGRLVLGAPELPR
jgi:hypothetical protein